MELHEIRGPSYTQGVVNYEKFCIKNGELVNLLL